MILNTTRNNGYFFGRKTVRVNVGRWLKLEGLETLWNTKNSSEYFNVK